MSIENKLVEIERLRKCKNILSDLLYKEEARANRNEAEIERLKTIVRRQDDRIENMSIENQKRTDSLNKEIERLKGDMLEWICSISDASQIVSGCRDDYERGRYEAFREILDKHKREATKDE